MSEQRKIIHDLNNQLGLIRLHAELTETLVAEDASKNCQAIVGNMRIIDQCIERILAGFQNLKRIS